MSHAMLLKIEKIKTQITELEAEKNTLTHQLKATLLNLFDDTVLEKCDFNTLIGGILSVQKIMLENDPKEQEHLKIWKNEGAQYLQKTIKGTRPKAKKSQKNQVN